MKKTLKTLFFLACFMLMPLISFGSNSSIGIVKSVTGDVTVVSADNKRTKAYENMKIFEGDTIRTTGASTIGLLFDDDTAVSFGPNSEMIVEEFIFNPVQDDLSFIAKFFHGSFSFLSGQLVKLAPEKVHLKTPDATLGVRGTKFIITVN